MYVDLAGLARYRQDFDAWARGALLPKDAAAARVRTAKAGAVSFVPVQQTPLDVSVDFLFTETPPAEGDKGPDNPSTISGVSSVKVTRCGKNLIKRPYLSESSGAVTIRGVTFAIDETTGAVTVNGKASGGDASFWLVGNTAFMRLRKNETYFLSGCPSGGSADTYFLSFTRYNLDGSYGAALPNDIGSGSSASYTEDWKPIIAIRVKDGVTVSNLVFKPQLELGSTATPFEKYEGTEYTIDLNGTYYGGILDVASGVMTVTSVLETITSSSPFLTTSLVERSNSYLLAYFPSVARQKQNLTSNVDIVCNSMPCIYGAIQDERCVQFNAGGAGIGLNLLKTDLGLGSGETAGVVKEAFLSWLEEKNIEVVYPVLTPFTVQLTPTEILSLTQPSVYDPRVNTVYTDASAVQVGYLKHPSAASADLRNAAVSLGGGV